MEKGDFLVEGQKKEKKKKKQKKSSDNLYRSMLTNLVRLSTIADQKAALMISVNAIIVSVIITFAFGKIDDNKLYVIPTIFILLVSIITIIYAVLATKPNVYVRKEMVDAQDLDLLFFGDFTNIDLSTYQQAMKNLIVDDNALHDKIIANIYAQGMVIKKKFKLLKNGYTVFLVGFPLAILCFVIVLLL